MILLYKYKAWSLITTCPPSIDSQTALTFPETYLNPSSLLLQTVILLSFAALLKY